MKTLFLAALFIGCIMLLTIPDTVEAQAGYYGGGWGWGRRCRCRYHFCYGRERYWGRCGWGGFRCCRRRYYW
ncbi:hypothetical protein ACF0H5_019229 [Mactra antiquata]